MSWLQKWSMLLPFLAASSLSAQLAIVDSPKVQTVFSGPARPVEIIFHNAGNNPTNVSLRTRIYQTSSSTAAPFGNPEPWKNLQVLPLQSVIELGVFDFPEVKHETHFLIQWINETSGIIGKTRILVYPTNLLAGLKPIIGAHPVGILDPGNQLKPSIKASGIDFEDLANGGMEKFSGNLAIVWTSSQPTGSSMELSRNISRLTKAGKAVVWIVPTQERGGDAEPRMLPLQTANSTVLILQSILVSDFQSNPQSQLNLLRAIDMATRPELLHFSESNNEKIYQ